MNHPPQKVTNYLDGVYPAFALLAGLRLDLFTLLSQRSYSVHQLAQTLHVDETKLNRLLLALTQAGLVEKVGDRFNSTTETAVVLNRNHPGYLAGIADFFGFIWGEVLPHTANSILSGEPRANFEFKGMNSTEIEYFLDILHPGAKLSGYSLAKKYDFSNYRTLLDVGGGSGGLTLALVEHYPQLQATVLDLPVVIPITHKFIQATDSRVKLMSANFIDDKIPGTYDVIVMKAFTQIFGEKLVKIVLRKAFSLLNQGGDLIIMAAILDDDRLAPDWAVQFDLVLLNMYKNGRAYTEQEYRTWLEVAGFTMIKRSDPSLIIARK